MMKNGFYLGIDVGSVSTNLVLVDMDDNIREKIYLRTEGQPIKALKKGLEVLVERLDSQCKVNGVGTTGSGRQLASVIVGADITKN